MDTPTQTPWLDAGQQRSWRSFLGGSTVLNDQLDRDLHAKHGLSLTEYEILVRLSEAEDRQVRMAELAAAVAPAASSAIRTCRSSASDKRTRISYSVNDRPCFA